MFLEAQSGKKTVFLPFKNAYKNGMVGYLGRDAAVVSLCA